MAVSPAKRHYQQTQAAAQSPGAETYANTTQYELMLMQLANHKARLKEIQSIERKVAVKRELLPEYDAYVDGVLASGAGVQDDVLMTVLVWLIDVGNLPRALELARYALAHGLETPEQYTRDAATLIAEEVAEAGLRAVEAADFATLRETLDLTEKHDMPDEVRAKLHLALGRALERLKLLPEALAHLRRAVELHERVGAKKDIERLERELRNAGSAPGS